MSVPVKESVKTVNEFLTDIFGALVPGMIFLFSIIVSTILPLLIFFFSQTTQNLEGEIKIVNPSPHIKKVMKLAGLDRLAKIDN